MAFFQLELRPTSRLRPVRTVLAFTTSVLILTTWTLNWFWIA